MERKKIIKTRNLTQEEQAISKKIVRMHLPRRIRKEYYARLMAGECFDTVVKPWIKACIYQHELEVDKYEEILEALTVCKEKTLPNIEDLEQALQISTATDFATIERQINLVVPMFYVSKPDSYRKKFKTISYHFIDELAEKIHFFNGNMITFIFAGDYFTLESGVLLAKHSKVLRPIRSFCRMKLNAMLLTLAQKENIVAESVEDIAMHIFHKALRRPLLKEEIAMLVIYALMQIYSWDMIDTKKKVTIVPYSHSKEIERIEKAIDYCQINGLSDISKWKQALTLTEERTVWDKQVALIKTHLLKGGIDDYTELKEITYRFIARSFRNGFLSSEIIDFIFDGRAFSNASTVVLALSCNSLKEHNLASYIQEKLENMMLMLIEKECINADCNTIANCLLDTSLNRPLNKEEISILSMYVLRQAFM